MFENNGLALGRWLMFGEATAGRMVQLSPVSFYLLTERLVIAEGSKG